MQTAKFVEKLERDLASVAALGGDAVADAAGRLAHALRSSAGMRLVETLGEAALEISAQLPEGHVEVRLAGPDPQLVYIGGERAEPPAVQPDDGLTARITLRLPKNLKRELEAAATREGVSLNTWLVRALQRSAAPPPRRTGKRLTGYAKN
jgi:HicB-like protein involved in pilus formation